MTASFSLTLPSSKKISYSYLFSALCFSANNSDIYSYNLFTFWLYSNSLVLHLLIEEEYQVFMAYFYRWSIFKESTTLFMLLRVYLPKFVNRLRIYAFYLETDLSLLDILDCRIFGLAEPSGMELNVMYRLSTKLSLNFSYYFFKADNFISSLVQSSFCFFN